jgi:putative addiction module component (TIGR02574 family)
MNAVHAVLENAMKLPKGERALVAFELLSSLEVEDKDAETAWKSEIEARLAVVAAGNYEAADWREVVADIRKSLHEGQRS